MDLKDRFRYIMKLNQLSASAFAEEIGVQRSSVSHILSGRNKPSLEFIQKVLDRFPRVNAAWLINGTTEMGDQEQMMPTEGQEKDRVDTSSKDSKIPGTAHDQSAISASKGEPKGNRRILKIVVFYDDHSFEEFNP